MPRTFKEIVAVSTVNKRDIGRCFKIILKSHEDTKVGLVDSGDFMSRFCGLLGLTREIQRAATSIAKKASDLELTEGRSPVSVSAASIYMASQASSDKRSHAEIAAIAGQSLQLIVNYYQQNVLFLGYIVHNQPSEYRLMIYLDTIIISISTYCLIYRITSLQYCVDREKNIPEGCSFTIELQEWLRQL